MPDPDYTAIGIVLDESGSMQKHIDIAVDGFNEFLDDQKQLDEGRASLTLTTFNHEYPPKIQHMELDSAEELSEETYSPGGRTALLDAVGYTINQMGDRFDTMDEEDKPSNVMVAIITDGKENASEEHTRSDVKSMVEEQKNEWGWEFIFVGAGIEDFADAESMGLSKDRMTTNSADQSGFKHGYDQVATASANLRRKRSVGEYQDGGRLDTSDEDDE